MSEIEKHSNTWLAVLAEADQIIGDATQRIVTRGYGPIETEYERGVIEGVNRILALARKDQDDRFSAEISPVQY